MGKKMFVITYGEYSDYRIESMWSSKEVAEEKLELLGPSYQIEEWDVDVNQVNSGYGDMYGVEVSYDFSQPGTDIREENLMVKKAIVHDYELDEVKFRDSRAIVKSVDVEAARRALIKEFS